MIYGIIRKFIWLEEIIEKLFYKHSVQLSEVKEIFADELYFKFVEKGHHLNENLYAALGKTTRNRYLIVFFIYKNTSALIISARDMSEVKRTKALS